MKNIIGILAVLLSINANALYKSIVNETLSYDKNYIVDMQAEGIKNFSAQAVYSSATISPQTFADGSVSTGSLTVLDLPTLSKAKATATITVSTTSGLTNAAIMIGNKIFVNGVDWKSSSTVSATALSIKTALAFAFSDISFSTGTGGVIYATAPYGSYYNSVSLYSSTPTAITMSGSYFTGGRDNATIKINGTPLTVGKDFNVVATTTGTAQNIVTAINANKSLSKLLVASRSTATINLISKKVGSIMNFALYSSIPTAISISGDNMTGGEDSQVTLNSSHISILSHGFNVGLPVLYSSTETLSPLVDGTTYYVGVINSDTIALASTSENAVVGTYITLTSSNTPSVANTYTLTPLAISASATYPVEFKWQVSNNGIDWSDVADSGVSINDVSQFTYPYAVKNWDFDIIGNRYIMLKVISPKTGAFNLNTIIYGH